MDRHTKETLSVQCAETESPSCTMEWVEKRLMWRERKDSGARLLRMQRFLQANTDRKVQIRVPIREQLHCWQVWVDRFRSPQDQSIHFSSAQQLSLLPIPAVYRSRNGPKGSETGQRSDREAEGPKNKEEADWRGAAESHDEVTRRRLVQEATRRDTDPADAADEHRR